MYNNSMIKKAAFLVRVTLSITILLFGMYFALTKRHYDTQYNKIASFDNIEAIGLCGIDVIEQRLCFATDNVHSIGICAVNGTKNRVGSFNISLLDNDKTIWEQKVEAKDMELQKIVWFTIKQLVEPQKEYTIRIAVEHLEGSLYIGGISRDKNAKGVTDKVIRNGEELDMSLVVETVARARLGFKTRLLIAIWSVILAIYIMGFEKLFKNRTRGVITAFITADLLAVSAYFGFGINFELYWNWLIFVGILFAFAMAAVMHGILLLKKCEKAELYFMISSIVFGIAFSIILPPFSAPDEDFHFVEAYRLSNAIMGWPINDEHGYVYVRECDSGDWEAGRHPDGKYTADMVKRLVEGDGVVSEEMVASNASRNGALSIVMYIPQAIGITIGRLLHLNYARVVFLGRWMNLITFVLITAFAIRLIPSGKWTFFAICQIPIVMEIVSSYSYDVLVLAGMLLFVAHLANICRNDNKITKKQIFAMLAIIGVLVNLKPVYIPLAALVFVIPDEKISDSRRKSAICKTVAVLISVLTFIFVYKYNVMSMVSISENAKPNADGAAEISGAMAFAESYNYDISDAMEFAESHNYDISDADLKRLKDIAFMRENPFDIVESCMGLLLTNVDEFILSMFGSYLGWYHIRIPIYVAILAMLLLYLGYTEDGANAVRLIGLKGKTWTACMMAASMLAIFLSMYIFNTMPSIKLVSGVQGRYLIPVLMVIPLFLKDRNGCTGKKEVIVMLSLLIQIVSVLDICRKVWG